MFHNVNAIVLLVNDFEKCLTFYRDTLELEAVVLEEKFAAFKMHDQDFAILHVSDAAPMVNAEIGALPAHGVQRILLCADVDDVDGLYTSLVAKGVEFTQAPIDREWGYRTAYFKDPESNIWEFRETIRK